MCLYPVRQRSCERIEEWWRHRIPIPIDRIAILIERFWRLIRDSTIREFYDEMIVLGPMRLWEFLQIPLSFCWRTVEADSATCGEGPLAGSLPRKPTKLVACRRGTARESLCSAVALVQYCSFECQTRRHAPIRARTAARYLEPNGIWRSVSSH
jgi:hypothetical protein